MKLGPPAPRSLLPCELLQLHGTWPCWSNAQDQVRRRGVGCCTARCSRMGMACVLPPASCQGWRHDPFSTAWLCDASAAEQPREREAATFLNTTLLSSEARVLCFFPFFVPLPLGALPKSARFSQASMKSSNPARYSKVFLFPLS